MNLDVLHRKGFCYMSSIFLYIHNKNTLTGNNYVTKNKKTLEFEHKRTVFNATRFIAFFCLLFSFTFPERNAPLPPILFCIVDLCITPTTRPLSHRLYFVA